MSSAEPTPPGYVRPSFVELLADVMRRYDEDPRLDRLNMTQRAELIEDEMEGQGYVVVDASAQVGEVDIALALRNWLTYTRAPSGAFGQSMENTMAYEVTRKLRAAAARYLTEHSGEAS